MTKTKGNAQKGAASSPAAAPEKRKKYMSVGVKLVGFYVIMGFIPLLIAYLYTFRVLRSTLEEEGYYSIRQEADQVGRLVDTWVDRYTAMMDSIYMDYYTNAYIASDYSQRGYEEMYPYIDKTLLRLILVCPDYTSIQFFSFNESLPEDGNYFHRVDEMKEEWFQKAVEANGFTVVAGIDTRKTYGTDRPHIGLVKLMNYFKNGSLQNVLQVQVDAYAMCDMLKSGDSACRRYVLSPDGVILASPDREGLGESLEAFTGGEIDMEHVGWDSPGELIDRDGLYMVTESCELGLRVLVIADKTAVLEKAERTSRDILLLLGVSVTLALSSILLYGKSFTRRINRIVHATGRLQEGDFSYYLRETSNDEIGKVADAMDELTGQMEILIKENYEKQLQLRDSEIHLLYEQIDPHFLYNALSTISSLSIMEGDRITNRCVKALGEFYRVSLNKGRRVLTVREEVELLKSYMTIQKLRFEDSIEIDYAIEEGILEYRCLKLLLQPVVENSIKYGIRDNNGKPLHIGVAAYEEDGCVCFVVEDDGAGMDPVRLKEVREAIREGNGGYGLKNIDVRIRLQYGEGYGLSLESEKGAGTVVTIRIPRVKWEENC